MCAVTTIFKYETCKMDMNIKNVDELMSDEGFLNWYYKKDPAQVALWNEQINNDPAQKKMADDAVAILDTIIIKEPPVSKAQVDGAEKRLFQSLGLDKPAPVIPLKSRNIVWRWAAAAVIILGLGFGAYTYFSLDKPVISTGFAEIRQESLPDGSQVTLNANSEVVFDKKMEKAAEREVWIKGEAFFKVQKTERKSRFIVHAGHFDVIVTGTEFNVVNRREKANVLLTEGSVIIRTADGKETSMKPGDFVEFANDQLQKKQGNDTLILGWKDRNFNFEKTPMKEVVTSIEEVYGVKVRLEDEALVTDSITGIMPADNLDVFLQSLEAAKNYEIVKNDKEILIRSKRR